MALRVERPDTWDWMVYPLHHDRAWLVTLPVHFYAKDVMRAYPFAPVVGLVRQGLYVTTYNGVKVFGPTQVIMVEREGRGERIVAVPIPHRPASWQEAMAMRDEAASVVKKWSGGW